MRPGYKTVTQNVVFYKDYNSEKIEGKPIMNMALIQGFDYVAAIKRRTDIRVLTKVQQEAGKWNDVFLSKKYQAYIYLMIILEIITLLRGFINLGQMLIERQYPKLIRSAIFTFVTIASISRSLH
ncbi:hypothetical protein BDF19DRAFT_455825 [Syncephalis fuscata]|nr:hypothetical protein BDF19DRAFT_455825 [Syncephalis fuscata]